MKNKQPPDAPPKRKSYRLINHELLCEEFKSKVKQERDEARNFLISKQIIFNEIQTRFLITEKEQFFLLFLRIRAQAAFFLRNFIGSA